MYPFGAVPGAPLHCWPPVPARGRLSPGPAPRLATGGGSLRSALLGGNLAKLAAQNGWTAVVIDGAIRDREECEAESVVIKALGSAPQKSAKAGAGAEEVPVLIGVMVTGTGIASVAHQIAIHRPTAATRQASCDITPWN